MTKIELEKENAELRAKLEATIAKNKELRKTHFSADRIRAEVVKKWIEYTNRCAVVKEWIIGGIMSKREIDIQVKIRDRLYIEYKTAAMILQRLLYPENSSGYIAELASDLSIELQLHSEDAEVRAAVERERTASDKIGGMRQAGSLGLQDEALRCKNCQLPREYGKPSPCLSCEVWQKMQEMRELKTTKKEQSQNE